MADTSRPFARPRMKPSTGCSGITTRACTQPWATSARCSSNKTGIAAPQPLQTDGAKPMKAGYGKAGKQTTLSNFSTATTTTNYNYLWDTDSEGKVSWRGSVAGAVQVLWDRRPCLRCCGNRLGAEQTREVTSCPGAGS